jgi:hypothetical protein
MLAIVAISVERGTNTWKIQQDLACTMRARAVGKPGKAWQYILPFVESRWTRRTVSMIAVVTRDDANQASSALVRALTALTVLEAA